jgi:hypothetical protein
LPGRRVAGDHLTRVHPDPSGDPDTVLTFELEVERIQRLPHPVGSPGRAKRVVLVQPRDPEDGHHGVADELLDGAAVAFDHGRHLVEVAAHHASERLGIQPLAEGRGPRDVGEDDRDDPADVGEGSIRLGERRRAVLAEASPVGVLFSAGGAPLHERILEGAREGTVRDVLLTAARPPEHRFDHCQVPRPSASRSDR